VHFQPPHALPERSHICKRIIVLILSCANDTASCRRHQLEGPAALRARTTPFSGRYLLQRDSLCSRDDVLLASVAIGEVAYCLIKQTIDGISWNDSSRDWTYWARNMC